MPEDHAGSVVWLASPASSYVTGEVITVDGGFTAGGSWEQAAASLDTPTFAVRLLALFESLRHPRSSDPRILDSGKSRRRSAG